MKNNPLQIQEFAVKAEVCTATMNSSLPTGECFGMPISVGYYTENDMEMWISAEGTQFSIQIEHLEAFIKQLRRAAKLAKKQVKA